MIAYILAFVAGGSLTLATIALELNGYAQLSRLAAIFPIVTWISYLFIGETLGGDEAVSKHALFVLLGTLIAWVPYMLVIYYFSPKIGTHRAIIAAIAVFLVLALVFTALYKK